MRETYHHGHNRPNRPNHRRRGHGRRAYPSAHHRACTDGIQQQSRRIQAESMCICSRFGFCDRKRHCRISATPGQLICKCSCIRWELCSHPGGPARNRHWPRSGSPKLPPNAGCTFSVAKMSNRSKRSERRVSVMFSLLVMLEEFLMASLAYLYAKPACSSCIYI